MKILIEITEQDLNELNNVLRILKDEFDGLYNSGSFNNILYETSSSTTKEARILRARKILGMSIHKEAVCYDLSSTP